jgi:thioesterase domain-containing protein
MPGRAEFEWSRQRRATVKAAGGVLDIMLPLRVTGGTTLFCAPPVVGLSWCYLALLPHIAAEHAIHGLQSRGLRRPEPLPATMGELAREFADHIRMVQPSGPYHLFGWSLGGNVAFAVAEELERRGEEVALLTVLDALPGISAAMTAQDKDAWLLYNFVLGEFGYPTPLIEGEPHPEDRVLEVVRSRPSLGLTEWPEQRVRALLRVIRNNVATARGYRPGRIRGSMLFIAATDTPPATEAKVAMWRSLVDGSIDVFEVPCQHQHMLLPEHLSRIGEQVSRRLSASTHATLS